MRKNTSEFCPTHTTAINGLFWIKKLSYSFYQNKSDKRNGGFKQN